MKDEMRRIGTWRGVFVGVCMVVCVVVCVGCGSRYVPVHYYHERESVRVERDSVHFADTVRIAEHGDTVFVNVIKWRTRYRSATDTVVKVDTVQLPPELVAPAPAKSWTDKWWAGFVFIALFLLVGAVAAYLLVKVCNSAFGI